MKNKFELLAIVILTFICTYLLVLNYNYRPPFHTNQVQYFLKGIAMLDSNLLQYDWRTMCIDGFPFFSFLIYAIYSSANPEFLVFATYFTLIFVYLTGLSQLSKMLLKDWDSIAKTLMFLAIIMFAFMLVHLKGYQFINGVAGFFLLNNYLQQCNFGVFLFLAMFLYLKNSYTLSFFSISVAMIFHPVYFVISFFLYIAMVIDFIFIKKLPWLKLIKHSLVFVVALPNVLYVLMNFGSTSKEISAEAFKILATIRFPHHVKPSRWLFDSGTYFKPEIIMIMSSILFSLITMFKKNKMMFAFLLIATTYGIGSAYVYLWTDNHRFAVSIPWRVFAIIIPLTTFINIAFITSLVVKFFNKRVILGLLLILLGYYGSQSKQNLWAINIKKNLPKHVKAVQQHSDKSTVYLTPSGKKFEHFRIATGVPVYVDNKNHPLKDREILEWWRRLKISTEFYKPTEDFSHFQQMLKKLKQEGITDVLFYHHEFGKICSKFRLNFSTDGMFSYSIAGEDMDKIEHCGILVNQPYSDATFTSGFHNDAKNKFLAPIKFNTFLEIGDELYLDGGKTATIIDIADHNKWFIAIELDKEITDRDPSKEDFKIIKLF